MNTTKRGAEGILTEPFENLDSETRDAITIKESDSEGIKERKRAITAGRILIADSDKSRLAAGTPQSEIDEGHAKARALMAELYACKE